MAEATLLTELLKTDRANTSFTDEQVRNAWENLLKILHSEKNASELLHYFIRQDDVVKSSLMDIIQGKADLQDGRNDSDYAFEELLNNLKGTSPSNFWNESVNTALKHFLKHIEITDDDEIIPGTNGQISYNDLIKANAGYTFTLSGTGNSNTQWVKPWKNIDAAKYQTVRAGDEIVQGVLNNKNELQFTHSQNQSNIGKWIRLLMPKYSRFVEIEDLDRNFWVIGQAISGISAYLFDDDSPIKTAFKNALREITELWENILYLWAALAMLSNKTYKDVHVEVVYLNSGLDLDNSDETVDIEYYTNIKYDDFTNSQLNWRHICQRLEYLKQQYPESNLAIIPIRRQNSYYNNYFTTVLMYGIAFYDRNNPNTSSYNGFRVLKFESNSTGGDLRFSPYSTSENVDSFEDYIIGVQGLANEDISCISPFSKVKEQKEFVPQSYYAAIRPKMVDVNITYDIENHQFKIGNNFKIELYDAFGCCITHEGNLLNNSIIGTYELSDTTGVTVISESTQTWTFDSIPEDELNEHSYTNCKYKNGCYLGEIPSKMLMSEEFSYDGIKEDSIDMPPISTDRIIDNEYKTYLYDILEDEDIKEALQQRNAQTLKRVHDNIEQYKTSTDGLQLLVGTRAFDLFKLSTGEETPTSADKRAILAEGMLMNGLGGYYDRNDGKGLTSIDGLNKNYFVKNTFNELIQKDRYTDQWPHEGDKDYNNYYLPMVRYTRLNVINTDEDDITWKANSLNYCSKHGDINFDITKNDNSIADIYDNHRKVFLGSHGGRIDQGAILNIPNKPSISYEDYLGYKVLPTAREKSDNNNGLKLIWIEGENQAPTRHVWNNSTTIVLTEGEKIKDDNWIIFYIKTYGGYAPSGALSNEPRVTSADKISYGYKRGGTIEKLNQQPITFAIWAHAFKPNGDYSSVVYWKWKPYETKSEVGEEEGEFIPSNRNWEVKKGNKNIFNILDSLDPMNAPEKGTLIGDNYYFQSWSGGKQYNFYRNQDTGR